MTRHSGYGFNCVKIVADKFIRPLLKTLMKGVEGESLVEEMMKSEEKELSENKCNTCDKTFKNIQGLSIHNTKMHGENKIHPAVKRTRKDSTKILTFSTGLRMSSKKTESEHDCQICKTKFSTKLLLNWHLKKCTQMLTMQTFNARCELCDEKFTASSKWYNIQQVLKHKTLCHQKPIVMHYRSAIACDQCDFKSQNEIKMRRHRRDKHDVLTKSTSPQSKKKRFDEPKDYKTQESEVVIADLSDNMEEMDFEETEIKDRSKKIEIKNMEKRKKDEKLEQEFKQLKFQKLQADKKEPEVNKKYEVKETNMNTQDEKKSMLEEMAKTESLKKKGIKQIDHKYHHLVGRYNLKYSSKMNGTCQSSSKSSIPFQDPNGGESLARQENEYLVENWYFFKNYFVFPHNVKIGGGKTRWFKNSKEFHEFLIMNQEACFVWSDHLQLQITANCYQVKVQVLSVNNRGEGSIQKEPFVPDPRLKKAALLPEFRSDGHKVEVPEVWLMYNGNHYDALIKDDDPLITRGTIQECPVWHLDDKEIDPKKLSEKDNDSTDIGDNFKALKEKLRISEAAKKTNHTQL